MLRLFTLSNKLRLFRAPGAGDPAVCKDLPQVLDTHFFVVGRTLLGLDLKFYAANFAALPLQFFAHTLHWGSHGNRRGHFPLDWVDVIANLLLFDTQLLVLVGTVFRNYGLNFVFRFLLFLWKLLHFRDDVPNYFFTNFAVLWVV